MSKKAIRVEADEAVRLYTNYIGRNLKTLSSLQVKHAQCRRGWGIVRSKKNVYLCISKREGSVSQEWQGGCF